MTNENRITKKFINRMREVLTEAAKKRCGRMRHGQSERIHFAGDVSVGDNEWNSIGYNLIGGANPHFYFVGNVKKLNSSGPCCEMEFDLRYVWYDVTDRNLKYTTDRREGAVAEALGAKPYSYVITWNGKSIWRECSSGSGWPHGGSDIGG
ncbi:hypothetical protein [Verrucomicrobium spinosum]|uniref:hypothetical protein n=1 Tax=Verrucomicrobium spinosum TaxID=2736 RepID=UPI0012F6DE0F|nr:hypothetical protein [Verrucomicrobium spinosum]